MVPTTVIDLLLYADDLEGIGVGQRGRISLVLSYCYMAALGAPFKWTKQRGGTTSEWAGLTTDYGSYSFGLSEKRSSWLRTWIEEMLTEGMVEPGIFVAGLGGLSFASLALRWERPFLGPLFSWAAAVVGQKGKLIIPWAVTFILKWISTRLEEGGRLRWMVRMRVLSYGQTRRPRIIRRGLEDFFRHQRIQRVPGWLPEESYCSSGDVGNAGCGEDLGPYLQAEGRGQDHGQDGQSGQWFCPSEVHDF